MLSLIDGEMIAENVDHADRFITRMFGLMCKKEIEKTEGLLISPCRQVHTFFMRFPIDVLFLSPSGKILMIQESMQPGKISPYVKDCFEVLELRAGVVKEKGITTSERVSFW